MQDIEQRVLQLVEETQSLLEPSRVQVLRELASAGEPGVALEILCDNLLDCNAALPLAVRHEIADVGKSMGINPKYWARLADPHQHGAA